MSHRSISLAALWIALGASACNSSSPTQSSASAAARTEDPRTSIAPSPEPSSAPSASAAAAPAPPLSASRYLPSECESRLFIDGATLFQNDRGLALRGLGEQLFAKVVPGAANKDRTERLSSDGASLGAVKSFARCRQAKGKSVSAFVFDVAKLGRPLSTIVGLAWGSATKPLDVRTEGEFARAESGALRFATRDADGLLIVADSAEVLTAALAGTGSAGFARSEGTLGWYADDDTEGSLVRVRDDAVFELLFPPPRRHTQEQTIKQLEKAKGEAAKKFATPRYAMFKPLLPLFEGAMLATEGSKVRLVSKFPATMLAEVLQVASEHPAQFLRFGN